MPNDLKARQDRLTPVSLETVPPPVIERLRDAMVLPVESGRGLANGVFRSGGSFADLSRTRISGNRFTDIPTLPEAPPEDRLAGRHLFVGIGRHHFGHFLVETAARLWALEGSSVRFDGLLILPMPHVDFAAVLRQRIRLFFDLMGCDMPIHLVTKPVLVDELFLPSQGFGHQQWAVGSAVFRRFMRHRIGLTCPADGPDRIYISRSKLKQVFQRVDQEERVERLMAQAGYTVFHPECHDVQVQCQVYRAARHIVGGDGSAFHLAPFAVEGGTRVGLIQRRARVAPVDAIADQISAFAPVDLVRLDPLRRGADGDPPPSVGRTEAQPISFRALKAQLEEAGLI